MLQVKRALVSVYDKTGIVEFAKSLSALGVEIISTGGTYRHLKDAGLSVTYVSNVTDFPEILDGRVKTLHPKIHGGILARRSREDDMRSLEKEGIKPIDLVAVNLYPFEETVARPGVLPQEILEMIDIGGPTLIRAAAKNHQDVVVVVNPSQYPEMIRSLKDTKSIDIPYRRRLAYEAFQHTATYDQAICDYFETLEGVR